MKVYVYRNLQHKCWSIKSRTLDYKYDLVIGHASFVVLTDCVFTVGEKGRERVVKEKHKNVHAGIVGSLCKVVRSESDHQFDDSFEPFEYYHPRTVNLSEENEVTYDPYRYNTFVYKHSEQPIYVADIVAMNADMTVFIDRL